MTAVRFYAADDDATGGPGRVVTKPEALNRDLNCRDDAHRAISCGT